MMLPLRLRAAFGYGIVSNPTASPDPVLEEPRSAPIPLSVPSVVDLPTVDGSSRGLSLDRDGQLVISLPELYHRLQNISDCALSMFRTVLTCTDPHALPMARRYLDRITADQLGMASPDDPTCVLSLPKRFAPDALRAWIAAANATTSGKYEAYIKRRRAGGPREMFVDRADAVR